MTDKVELPEAPRLDFEVEKLYEESDDTEEIKENESVSLIEVKGIGKGTAETLKTFGISSIEELLGVDPEELSAKMSGVSPNKVIDWQKSAKILIKT